MPRRYGPARVRILLVSQMYPGPDDPDLGTFVAQLEHALRERGHDVDLAVLDHRAGGKRRADAYARRGRGSRTFVGDGPLRTQLEGRERVRLVGRVPHAEVVHQLAAADVVCAPSLLEPFGQAILEAMACGRTVVATRLGGPPEFVTEDAGILVDPLDEAELGLALERATAFPTPNAAAREAASAHDVKL